MSDMRFYVAGHNGLVGSEVSKKITQTFGKKSLIVREKAELDLTNQAHTFEFLKISQADVVIMCAAKVGGIIVNSKKPAEFIYENLQMQNNIIQGAKEAGIKKLIFLGSSCIYPRNAAQPIQETALLSGPLEKTNEAYAIAKISGLEMCKHYTAQYNLDYRSLMPSNLYGLRDNFSEYSSHVIPALIEKIIKAKSRGEKKVTLLGTGKPLREFLWAEDFAEACVHILKLEKEKFREVAGESYFLNIGSGHEISVKDLAQKISKIVEFKGELFFDSNYPDGTPRKILDSSKIKSTGWMAKTSLEAGLQKVIKQQIKKQA